MTTQPTRRPRPTKPEEPQAQPRLAPAFDRDALALSFLHDKGYLSRDELRDNLRMLGVRLGEEEQRRLPVPTVVRIEATTAVTSSIPVEESGFLINAAQDEDDAEPAADDEDRWWDQIASEEEA
jgi:hypothetical protein